MFWKRFVSLPFFCSKKLLEYACFHKADLEEADRDKDGNGDSSHSHSGGHGRGGKGASDYDAYSHKVGPLPFRPCSIL